MTRPRTTPGMKFESLQLHGLVLVACKPCLKELGITLTKAPPGFHWLDGVEFDHDPALGLGRQFHKAKYLAPRCCPHHDAKTKTDLARIAKMKRNAEAHRDHEAAMVAKRPGVPRPRTGSIASRGFDTRFRRPMNGKTERIAPSRPQE